MIRYINIANQLESEKLAFCWYDTIVDRIIAFSGENVWDCWDDFESAFNDDYKNKNTFGHKGYDLDRFEKLYPYEVKK